MNTRDALWHGIEPLVLASTSTARRAMLAAAGIPADCMAAQVDERSIEDQLPHGTDPQIIATALASAKALDVSRRFPGRFVLGGDQVLTLGPNHQRFHKPQTHLKAADQLATLAGKTHQLTSAAALARDGQVISTCASHALMTMRALSGAQISAYLEAAGMDILSSAGGYHIEGLGVHLFDKIGGDHFTIQGLPLLGVMRLLRDQDLLA
jgi:septum formation protein